MNDHCLTKVPADQCVIYLAGGCFWGIEKLFVGLPGVLETTVGYANGNIDAPTYEQVCAGGTEYQETVRVVYDPGRISLRAILAAYFTVVDPTAVDFQGPDRGHQYQAGVYYVDEKSRLALESVFYDERRRIAGFSVELGPLVSFWPAEEYHQGYLRKHPGGYCHISAAKIAQAVKNAS